MKCRRVDDLHNTHNMISVNNFPNKKKRDIFSEWL